MSRPAVPRVRVVLRLPERDEVAALAVSLGAHVLLLLLALAAGSRATFSGPPRPALSVRLAAAATAPRADARPSAKAARRKATPPAARKKSSPKKRRRTRARQPKTIARKPAPASAQPRELPHAEPEPAVPAEEPPPAPADAGRTGEAKPEPASGAPEPIEGGIGGMETDEPFSADWYVSLVVARLQDAWRDRPVLPAGAAPRRVVVGFSIERDGRVGGARILVPSGYPPLDFSALRAVESVGRLPPLPRSYERDRLGARFVFELVPPS